jgi:hypothetical protein
MTKDEQKQFENLQQELSTANRTAQETRSLFSSELGKSNTEARLYRGLFWCLLAMLAAAAVVHILQR